MRERELDGDVDGDPDFSGLLADGFCRRRTRICDSVFMLCCANVCVREDLQVLYFLFLVFVSGGDLESLLRVARNEFRWLFGDDFDRECCPVRSVENVKGFRHDFYDVDFCSIRFCQLRIYAISLFYGFLFNFMELFFLITVIPKKKYINYISFLLNNF